MIIPNAFNIAKRGLRWPTMLLSLRLYYIAINTVIFFFLVSQSMYKRCRGAQSKVHREYTRESLRGKGETKKKI